MDFATTPSGRRQESPEEKDPYSSPTQSIIDRQARWQQRQRQRSVDHHYLNTSVNIATAFAEEARRQTTPRADRQRTASTSFSNSIIEEPSKVDSSSPGDSGSFWLGDHDDSGSDVDPLEELDALAKDLDEDDWQQQQEEDEEEEEDDIVEEKDSSFHTARVDDSNNNSSSSSSNSSNHDSLQNNSDGILWPFMRPAGEILYEKVAFALFLVVYSFKETLLAMIAYVDMVTCVLVVNSTLFVLHRLQIMRDKDYVNPLRMLRRREQSQMLFQVIAAAICLYVLYGLAHNQQPAAIVRYSSLRDTFHDFVNHNTHPDHLHPASPEDIRATVERILSGIIPQSADGKQTDFITGLQAYLDDHYVQRAELKDTPVSEQPVITQPEKQQEQQQQQQQQQQLADFALATRGARIIPKMTSATYTPDSRHPWRSALAQVFGIHPGSYRPSPLVALLPETHVGQCWPMKGANGTLGIVLSEPIGISGVTMEYPVKELTPNTSSAPHEFEVWGLRQVKVPAFAGVQWPWETRDTNAEHLGTFRYDTRSGQAVQTFDVNNHKGVFEGVIFRIVSNWGRPSYTCVYRARVHGTPLT